MYEDGSRFINGCATLYCRLGDVQLFSMLYAKEVTQSAPSTSLPSYVPVETCSDTKAPDIQVDEASSPSTLNQPSTDMRTPEDWSLSSIEPFPTPESRATDDGNHDATNPPAYGDVPPVN